MTFNNYKLTLNENRMREMENHNVRIWHAQMVFVFKRIGNIIAIRAARERRNMNMQTQVQCAA